MNNLHATMKDILERADVEAFRELNRKAFPQYPQPENDASAEISLHYARTQTQALELKFRAWSHRWLSERGHPSGLPDELKPAAERLYPRHADTVGIAIGSSSAIVRPAITLVRKSMEDAVAELHADGVSLSDPETVPLVKQRMAEARAGEMKRLFGRVTGAGIP